MTLLLKRIVWQPNCLGRSIAKGEMPMHKTVVRFALVVFLLTLVCAVAQVKRAPSVPKGALVAKYDATDQSLAGDKARIVRRDEHYDRLKGPSEPIRDPCGRGFLLPEFTHWDRGLPALPVAQSAVIVSGTVVSAQARLSHSHRSVYSEFTVRVDSVFKKATNDSITDGSEITVDRDIGAIEFPSGRTQYYGAAGKGSLQAGTRYILFLAADGPSQDLSIITAYELKGNAVFAVDGITAPGGGRSQFNEYDGSDATVFVNTVRQRIVRPQ
jgi:hypothetical protein